MNPESCDQLDSGNLGKISNPTKVNCDKEAWVKARIKTAMRMAIKCHSQCLVGADERMWDSAFDGIANGAAIEVIYSLGLQPGYINLNYPDSWMPEYKEGGRTCNR